jgi:hypothetical protein
MPFTIVLPPDVMAMAEWTAQERPRNIQHHRPSKDPHADLVGALAEHAWAYHTGVSQTLVDSSGGPLGRGDGGWDFTLKDETVKLDIKASRIHPESWVMPGVTPLKADWYIFAYVILPDTVIFQGYAHRSLIEPMVVLEIPYELKGKRLVYLTEISKIDKHHFKTSIPRRPKEAAIQSIDSGSEGSRVRPMRGKRLRGVGLPPP